MILPTHIVASGGIITNDRDEILLVKNPRKGWEYPGGIIEPGETLTQRLIREIKEETGEGFSCLGYQVNSSNEIEVLEEYLFDR